MMINRIRVFANLLLASIIALIEVPLPNMFPGVVHYTVKRVDCWLYTPDGEPFCDDVHDSVQSYDQGPCDVVGEDEQDDGDSGPDETDGSGRPGEHQPNGGQDEERT
jgi:hypothetical protein